MWDWDIVAVLVLPVILATLMLGIAVGVAWIEYRHRH